MRRATVSLQVEGTTMLSILDRVRNGIGTVAIVGPDEALAQLASKGAWAQLAQLVYARLVNEPTGSLVRFDSLGLTPDDFKRTKASASKRKGDIDYSGITAASRVFGMQVKRLTDESRGFYLPTDHEQIRAKVAAQRKAAAAKAKASKAK